ncbi:segregation/condensation protein A [Clostridium sp. KNHs214]|uniref:segregation/condensation protein A n=1 Tax=Clostridium sp. KNHs214 TaxID=1540257 RepID=UPI00068AA7A5|nr:segregation/condensation protein A [Clostridium sp. KNHs214]
MALNIKIHNFEGPFDLLLHLIKKNQMDIYHIRIHEITKQYMDYINTMKEMDLEITSEFIVIAATLLEIKSRMLLPKVTVDKDQEPEEDPEEFLLKKLIEYNKFKKAAEFFKEKEIVTGATFGKKPEIIEEKKSYNEEDFLKNITMLELFNIYSELMSNYLNKLNKNSAIEKELLIDNFKVEDKMAVLKYKMQQNHKLKFSDVMRECRKKMEVIVTFLALLELVRLRVVKAYQQDNFSEIFIERIEEKDGIYEPDGDRDSVSKE